MCEYFTQDLPSYTRGMNVDRRCGAAHHLLFACVAAYVSVNLPATASPDTIANNLLKCPGVHARQNTKCGMPGSNTRQPRKWVRASSKGQKMSSQVRFMNTTLLPFFLQRFCVRRSLEVRVGQPVPKSMADVPWFEFGREVSDWVSCICTSQLQGNCVGRSSDQST